jgi:hypothetical protein
MKKLIILFTFFFFSCTKNNDGNESTDYPDSTGNNTVNNTDIIPADYVGQWKGTYSGAGSGTWTVTVYKDGKVIGTIVTNIPTRIKEYTASGTVSKTGDIKFYQAAPVSGPTFVGKLIGTKASGTMYGAYGANGWETWEGTKQ